MSQKQSQQWFNSKQIMDHFNISRSTLVRWEKKGFPVHRQGYVKRYEPAECDKWMSSWKDDNRDE